MKELSFIAIAALVFLFWDDINPPPDYGAMHDEQVILYATEWCGYCQKARELMDEHNISYYEYDIETSAEGNELHKKLGGNGIPVLLIDGEVVKGYSPSRILRLANKT